MTENRAVVIGAGIGGLLAAAFLVREHNVDVYEKLPQVGGRFYNLPFKGYQLSTGALHMIPHGPTGPMALMISAAGAEVKIVKSVPDSMLRLDGKDIPFRGMGKHFPTVKKLKMLAYPIRRRRLKGTIADVFGNDPYLVGIADSFFGWSCSMKASEVTATEGAAVLENIRRFGTPGVPLGGCSSVCDALRDVIETGGGRVHTSNTVERIITRKGDVEGIVVNGERVDTKLVFSDVGHRMTSKLLDKRPAGYGENESHHKPSAGIKINFGTRDGFFDYGGVLLTPHTRRVNGIIQPTNIDPGLAPKGHHLVMSHQAVHGTDLNREIELGLKDIGELYPSVDYEVLAVQCYAGDWPVNRVASGYDAGPTTPIKGLQVVGDGAKVHGGVEVEGVAMGVARALTGVGIEHGVEL